MFDENKMVIVVIIVIMFVVSVVGDVTAQIAGHKQRTVTHSSA